MFSTKKAPPLSSDPEGYVDGPSLGQAAWYFARLQSNTVSFIPSLFRHAAEDRRISGPVTMAQLQQFAANGRIDRSETLVWREGMEKWQPAGLIPDLYQHSAPPPLPQTIVRPRGFFRLLFRAVYLTVSFALMLPLMVLSGFFFGARRAFRISNVSAPNLLTHWFATVLAQVASVAVGIIAMMTVVMGEGVDLEAADLDVAIGFYFAVFAVNYLLWTSLLHRCWNRIPDKYQIERPVVMTMLMFVPVVNIYAMLLSIAPLSDALHRTMCPGYEPPDHRRKVAFWLTLACAVPFVNLIAGACMVAWLIAIRRELFALGESDVNPVSLDEARTYATSAAF